MADARFAVDYAKRAAKCQKCKQGIDKGSLRLAKLVANIFNDDGGDMKQYHHPVCLFESFKRARATTKVIDDPGDIEGWNSVRDEDKEPILSLIRAHEEFSKTKSSKSPKKNNIKKSPLKKEEEEEPEPVAAKEEPEKKTRTPVGDRSHKDNSFREFRRLVAAIADTPSYLSKTELVRKKFEKKFHGDLHVWVRLLLPGVIKRIYNLQSKQLVKVFSRAFGAKESLMLTDLEQGDVAETVATFFENSCTGVVPAKKASLGVHDVDEFLDTLTKRTKESEQEEALAKMACQCTVNDLKMVVRLIKGDLRMQAGAKHVLDALHKDAHEAFNSSRNIESVLDRILELRQSGTPNGKLEVGASLMTPVQPMLALACKSVEMAFEKCPNGMYSEIKYDGERVQLHKSGTTFKYFSRSLKPVLAHKVGHFKNHIPKAFPQAADLILDAEVLMVDTKTGTPLPFGTLGVHKAAGFADATPCLFVFDCLYYNGQNLMDKPIKERKSLLERHMVEVGNNVKLSEMKHVTQKAQLSAMIKDVLSQGLEGLVLKDVLSTYEPGKRHWLKVKKDYLNEGAMADSADLVVLGAWYGTGNRGGIMSVFLMGCHDAQNDTWATVTKVHTGHDDSTLDRLQRELKSKVVKIKQDFDHVPSWLKCTRQMTPDFVAKDPQKMPVWEVTGAEFTKAEIHTANGISIRFPRVTRIREDKDFKTATSLNELQLLFENSRQSFVDNVESVLKSEEIPQKSSSPVKESENFVLMKHDIRVKLGASGRSFDKEEIACSDTGFLLRLHYGDLFQEVEPHVSLAHCVSQDLKMNKGIAKEFRSRFGRVSELQKEGVGVGGVAVLAEGSSRFIYNLVTKAKYSGFPTYECLRKSLEAMREHAVEHNVKEIAMPRIGCGLDKLEWNAVRTLLKNVFLRHNITLTIFHLDSSADKSPSKTSKRPSDNVAINKAEPPEKRKKKEHPMLDIAEGRLTPITEKEVTIEPLKFDHQLANIFTYDKVFVHKDVKDLDRLKRYVVAYGGQIIDECNFDEATVVVKDDASKPVIQKFGLLAKKKAVQVTSKWLVDSIKGQHRQSLDPYTI